MKTQSQALFPFLLAESKKNHSHATLFNLLGNTLGAVSGSLCESKW